MPTIPSQSHALLLTDVVDSTKLSEQLGAQANGALWAEHDRVARKLLAEQRGFELERTDGIGGLFPSVDAALAFAAAYHAATAALPHPLVVRAALHAGDLTVRENPPEHVARGAKRLEVDGLGVAVAARVLSVCGGGSTLLTADRPGARSRGHWRLKGVSEPVELFQVGDGAAPADAAKAWRVVQRDGAWVPARDVPHHLPAERDAFVGREADLRALADLLERSRLISVLGIGGTGKTRLVTRFAWTWLGDYAGGAWFCDLSEARSVDGICHAVAAALDVPLGEDDPVAQLGHAIAGRGECLVVLDNFEQVARYAPQTVGRWLDRAPLARFVVTTREVLGLPGESALPLAPLAEDDSVGLFVARARQARPDFADDDPASVRALVALLDHLPLAIELAAARVRVMPPKTLLERMSQRFKLLASTGGRHTRQATLRGALDWSWDLLSPDEQSALAQLSVFEGGFTLEAAEGVLALAELWPTDAVQALVDKSLVRQVSAQRFDLLVSVQEYAAEKLDALAGRTDAETRHGAWFAALGTDEALDALSVHGGTARRRALAAELDNLVAACRRAVARGDGAVAVATLRAAWAVLALRGPFAVGADLGAAALGLGLSGRDAARAGHVLGRAQQDLGRPDQARGTLERSLAVAREVGDARLVAAALSNLGSLHREQGRPNEAGAHFEQALALAREAGDRRTEGNLLVDLGNVARTQGRIADASALTTVALGIAREVGDRRAEGTALANLGSFHYHQGRSDEARTLREQAIVVAREVGNRRSECNVLSHLGDLHRHQGRVDEARALYEQALALARQVGNRRVERLLLGQLGDLHQDQGRMDEARALHRQALALHREAGDRQSEGWALNSLGNVDREQGRNEEARALYEQALALARDAGDRAFEGSVIGNLANVVANQGRFDEARALYEQSLAVARQIRNRRSEANMLGNLGIIHRRQGRLDEARACYEQSLALHREIGNRHAEGMVLHNLGNLSGQQRRMDDAQAFHEQAIAIARQLGNRPSEGELLGTLGALHLELGRLDEARSALADSERILREVDDRPELAKVLCDRARLEAALGRRDDARRTLAEAEALAAEFAPAPESALGRGLAEARAALEAS